MPGLPRPSEAATGAATITTVTTTTITTTTSGEGAQKEGGHVGSSMHNPPTQLQPREPGAGAAGPKTKPPRPRVRVVNPREQQGQQQPDQQQGQQEDQEAAHARKLALKRQLSPSSAARRRRSASEGLGRIVGRYVKEQNLSPRVVPGSGAPVVPRHRSVGASPLGGASPEDSSPEGSSSEGASPLGTSPLGAAWLAGKSAPGTLSPLAAALVPRRASPPVLGELALPEPSSPRGAPSTPESGTWSPATWPRMSGPGPYSTQASPVHPGNGASPHHAHPPLPPWRGADSSTTSPASSHVHGPPHQAPLLHAAAAPSHAHRRLEYDSNSRVNSGRSHASTGSAPPLLARVDFEACISLLLEEVRACVGPASCT